MNQDVAKYCETCSTCRWTKSDNQRPYGLLNLLQIPDKPWESIGVDFVGPLPTSKNRNGVFDMLIVVIDRLSLMVHLIPGRQDCKAKEMAEVIFSEIYRLHGLPKTIVSDRDSLFTSTFWTHLHKLIGVELKMSSAYHPQTDGATERANRTVTQMLRQCVKPDQKDWVWKLPAIEFAINLAHSESTGYSPFFLNSGRMPRSLLWDKPDANEYPGVSVFAWKMKNAMISAHDSLLDARAKQTRLANRYWRPAPFKENDLVYISTKNISFLKGRARKLLPKYIGPYRIVKDFGNNSFRVLLPAHLKQQGLHDVFHLSLLRIHIPNDDRLFPGRSDSQVEYLGGKDGEWMIEKIRSHSGSAAHAVFEVIWKSGDVTWLPYEQISQSRAMADYLESQGVSSVRELGGGSGNAPNNVPETIVACLTPTDIGFDRPFKGRRRGSSGTSTAMQEFNRHFKRMGNSGYILADPNTCKNYFIPKDQVIDIVQYDRLLRAYKHHGTSIPKKLRPRLPNLQRGPHLPIEVCHSGRKPCSHNTRYFTGCQVCKCQAL